MSRSVVDTERIAAAAGDIQRNSQAIESNMSELRGRLSGLDGSWEGPARLEFMRVMQEHQTLQARLAQNLGDIGRMTLQVSSAYAEHETRTRALFAR
jgi:WXG100 family type VII secretion target